MAQIVRRVKTISISSLTGGENFKKWAVKPQKLFDYFLICNPVAEMGDKKSDLRDTTTNEMWWLIVNAADFWGRGPGFGSSISHNDHAALHCVHCRTSQGRGRNLSMKQKRSLKFFINNNILLFGSGLSQAQCCDLPWWAGQVKICR